MATRLYGVATTAAPISPGFDADWQSTTGAVRRSLSTSKGSATETRSSVSVTSGANNETLGFQLISAPLSAQTVSGTVTIMTRGRELATSDNINRRARGIRVVSNDGSTVRGTLLAQGFHSATTELGTSLAGYQAANATSLSSVSAQDGDRIVVEIGYGMSSTGTSPQYDMVIGGSGTDHANSDGTTTGTVPWVEFSADLTFQPPSGEYTILTTQTPDTEDPASGQERMLGLRFTSTDDGTVVRGRWYVGATATSAATTALWQLWRTSDTTKLVEVDVQALGDSTTNDWIEFDVPDTAITAGTQYVVTRYTDDGYPFNYLASGTYPVTNGPLSADTSVFVNNQTSNDYPTGTEGTAMFFADVVVSYGGTGATATPSVVAGAATVPAATVNTGSAVTPTAVAATAAVPAATVQIGAAISPAVVAATASVPAPTVAAGSAVTPATVAAAAVVPAATVQAGSTVTASTIATAATVPEPAVSAGGATPTPDTVQTAATVPAMTVAAGAVTAPATVAGTSTVPAPTLTVGSTVTPATVAAAAAVAMPSVSAGGSVTVNPSTITTTTATPAPTVQTGSTVAADTVAAAATVPAAMPNAGVTVTLTTINGVAAVLAPTVATTGGATVTPATIAAVATILAVTVAQTTGAGPRTVASNPAGRQKTSSRPRQTTASSFGRHVTSGRPR